MLQEVSLGGMLSETIDTLSIRNASSVIPAGGSNAITRQE